MNNIEQFAWWLDSKWKLHKDDVDMLNYYRRNEGYLRDGFISGVESKQAELDKANARIAQLEEALSYARYFSLDEKATAALNTVRDNPLPSTWLFEHDKAVEVRVLEDVFIMANDQADVNLNIYSSKFLSALTIMIEARK